MLHTTGLAGTSLGVGAGPVAVDARRGVAFVTTVAAGYDGFPAGPSTLMALDLDTGRVRAQIRVGHLAVALAVDTWTGRLFVANEGDNTVSVIDTTRL